MHRVRFEASRWRWLVPGPTAPIAAQATASTDTDIQRLRLAISDARAEVDRLEVVATPRFARLRRNWTISATRRPTSA